MVDSVLGTSETLATESSANCVTGGNRPDFQTRMVQNNRGQVTNLLCSIRAGARFRRPAWRNGWAIIRRSGAFPSALLVWEV